jgi:diguanylate cyclase (GGDEF)-like protein
VKLVRLGALFGSLVLLVATTVSLFDTRSELRSRQQQQAVSASIVAADAVVSTTTRMEALVDAANAATTPSALTASFGPGAAACSGTDSGGRGCADAAVGATDAFGEAVRRSVAAGGAAVVVIDPSNATALAVARDDGLTTGLEVPVADLVGSSTVDSLAALESTVTVSATKGPSGDATTAGGRSYTASTTLTEPFEQGAVTVAATTGVAVGIGAGAPLLYGTLLALGTVLLALAGWTFLVERRSLEERATTDELTGLANRREFEEESTEELLAADRAGTGVCVMLLDLNGFKKINDTLGHHVGDLVLQGCGERLRAAVRDGDLVGRWGGDEFVVLLPGIEDGSAVRVAAERIGSVLSASPIVDDISISASIGAALYPRHGTTLDELVRSADVAMYGAKTSGVTYRIADSLALVTAADAGSVYHGPERRRPHVG